MFSWYDAAVEQPGNLYLDTSLVKLDQFFNQTGRRGIWDIGDGMCGQSVYCNVNGTANDSTPCGKVWNEPFCGGSPKGPSVNYQSELKKIAGLVATRPHIAGLFLGDEGILLGVDEDKFCRLANDTKVISFLAFFKRETSCSSCSERMGSVLQQF